MAADRTIWDFWAPRYERLWAQHFSLRPSRELVHARIAEAAPDATRFLDVGCGVGQFARELAERIPAAQVVGVDPTVAMIERARTDHAHPRVEYRLGVVGDVDRGDGFDVVTCMHAFPYIADAAGAMRSMAALLRPGGRLLIIQANTETAWDGLFLKFVKLTTTPATYRSARELHALMAGAGLAPGVVRGIPKPFFIPSIQVVEGVRPAEAP